MKFIKKTLIITILSSSLFSKTIIGIGYGKLDKEAKLEALANLSNNITKKVKNNSICPMVGVSFDKNINKDGSIKYIATLDSEKVGNIYRKEIKKDLEKILYSMKNISNIEDINKRYKLLLDTLKDIDTLNEYKSIAKLLEIKNIPILDVTKDDLLLKFKNDIPSVSSIKMATKKLIKNIDKSNIYVKTFKQNNISNITPFSKLLKDNIIKEINSTKYSSNADYFLTGEYEIFKDSIFIVSKLKDINNRIIKMNMINFNKTLDNISYSSSLLDFYKTINNGYIESNKLFVNIGLKGFNRFKEIDLNSDDKINIFVNSNKPICYFIVGDSLKDNKKQFSYTIGDMRVLNTSDINKNILLYEDIPISKPYGVEALQIFASDLENNGTCSLVYPKCRDNYEGYCVIEGEPATVISNIRELNSAYKKDNIEKVENSIIFTSFKKIK